MTAAAEEVVMCSGGCSHTARSDGRGEREQFEAAVRALPRFNPEELRRRDMAGSERLGEYVTYATEHAWRIWQAARSAEQGATPPAPAAPSVRHVANEWADMATNGIQWLRNETDAIDYRDALSKVIGSTHE